MKLTEDEKFARSGWTVGPDLWRVGFTLNGISLISSMSGLVDIYGVEYDGYGNLLFYVKRKDITNTLFVSGDLRATKVLRFKLPHLLLKVDAGDYATSCSVFN